VSHSEVTIRKGGGGVDQERGSVQDTETFCESSPRAEEMGKLSVNSGEIGKRTKGTLEREPASRRGEELTKKRLEKVQ